MTDQPGQDEPRENDEDDRLSELAERREPIILDPRTNEVLGTVSSFSWEEYYSGPLPTPQQLDDYNRVSAGLGDRIVTEWQTEGSHRRRLEQTALRAQLRAQSRGQYFALVIALVVIFGGLALLFTDRKTAGLVAILAPLATLAAVFAYIERRSSRTSPGQPEAADVDSTEHLRRAAGTRRNRT